MVRDGHTFFRLHGAEFTFLVFMSVQIIHLLGRDRTDQLVIKLNDRLEHGSTTENIWRATVILDHNEVLYARVDTDRTLYWTKLQQ